MRSPFGFVLLALLGMTGCILPLSTAAPQSASTVGKGKFGATGYAEFPSVTLSGSELGWSPFGEGVSKNSISCVGQIAYGLTDTLDLELGVEGMLYFVFLPVPLGVNGGVRLQLLDAPQWKISTAGRLGYSALPTWSESGGDLGTFADTSALHGMVSGVAQYTGIPTFHPSIALSYFAANVWYGTGGRAFTFTGAAAVNLTLDFGLFELTPFAGVASTLSPGAFGARMFPQFGIALALRPTKPESGSSAGHPAPSP